MKALANHNKHFPVMSLILILLLCGLFVAYLLVKPGDPHAVTLIDNLTQGLLEGVGLFLALQLWLPWEGRMRSSARLVLPGTTGTSSSQRWIPLLLGLGILSYIIGQGIWTYNENIVHLHILFPSWADAGYLGSYPFVLLAILSLPRRPLQPQTRLRVLLDGLMIMVGVTTVSWYFVLGPTILQGADTLAGQIIGLAYPLATLVLILCLLLLVTGRFVDATRPTILLLCLALATIVITDSIYGYLELHNLYVTGGLLDVGWPLGYMLVGLSARSMSLHLASRTLSTVQVKEQEATERVELSTSLWRALTPALTVATAVLLLIWTEYAGDSITLKPGVALGVAILLGLLVGRQIFVLQEMSSTNSRLRRMHEELRQANAQLVEQAWIEGAYERQHRLNELKDEFIMNVNHELRTPLTQVFGFLDLLGSMHDTLTSEQRTKFIAQAMQGCEALLQLVNTVLDSAVVDWQMSPPQPQELSVVTVVHEILELFGPQQSQMHPTHLEIPDDLLIQADPQYLRRVLRNLVSNAFKYAPIQTAIRIEARRHVSLDQPPNGCPQVCISVQDAGPGIPPEDIPLLFGKFVRLKRDLGGSIQGTGLGLYISKQLVEAMNGSIWVESLGVAGQGSRFCFTLPAPLSHRAK